jgi:hypothetical protein
MVPDQHKQKVTETLIEKLAGCVLQPCNPSYSRDEGRPQMIEDLPKKQEALSGSPKTVKIKKQKATRKQTNQNK